MARTMLPLSWTAVTAEAVAGTASAADSASSNAAPPIAEARLFI
jgi:hypothetical protein